uniref:PNPLA domain-containing protein n=1 Tax=viral metagenome TaxID=1070528 RepID=A0A6C0CHR6_9ZZZZ
MNSDILALNGGGMRGALQIGALQELATESTDQSLADRFSGGVYGYSIGALIGTLIAFEFEISEFSSLIEVLGNMQDALHPPRLQTLLTFTQTRGADDGSKIRDAMAAAFSKHGMNLDTLRVGDAAIPLHIIASDLTDLKTVIFGPSVLLWDALRASFSLPYIFTPHTIGTHLYVDGAVLCLNISKAVPRAQRERTLFLLTAHTKDFTTNYYLDNIAFARNIKETHDTRDRYPQNTCLLIEDDAKMFSFWKSTDIVEHLLAVGRRGYTEFRTKCRHQELA